ncbi:RNA ligase family protein [Musicola paradisiaca]|uniref:DNA ligase III-like protein n=1 Tax=Musicola paradisiaca (strain Ech703) TaxID=579405 RepID=C6C4P0_MUSP7|nr:RNA ligase family protein [Musicola paradisiaca]ACS87447.1 DNA ligase III-like protein [Musicola paradisiaca Ech703]
MSEFFRFPHTPHLTWLGDGSPRDDKVLSPNQVKSLLTGEVVVEEKLDGANVGLSLAPDGCLRVQNRGQYLVAPHTGQFARMPAWLAQHSEPLCSKLTPDLILFGEWCAARHSLDYVDLPDWFLIFDVYDRTAGRFWSSSRRNVLAASMGLATVPQILNGNTTVNELSHLVATTLSKYRQGVLEGVVVRRESLEWCEARAKLVRSDFTQIIDTHWRKRALQWNRLKGDRRVGR